MNEGRVRSSTCLNSFLDSDESTRLGVGITAATGAPYRKCAEGREDRRDRKNRREAVPPETLWTLQTVKESLIYCESNRFAPGLWVSRKSSQPVGVQNYWCWWDYGEAEKE